MSVSYITDYNDDDGVCLTLEGMSDISCDRSVKLGDHLSRDVMSQVYTYPGPAARISNDYYYRDGTYHAVEPEDRGTLQCISLP